ncbi:hypothetical protein H2C82_23555 [Vibrio parahaemolyticus]|uniref:hypothetical protein n=1 Tax=Vibrio parahaemolyticus TaxID=670 RepID=UPI002119EE19|nr:hypothetical protein [Vibrio parahaemolyticus]MCQ9058005.1 hypothetical protein [Vibrio parahaemolyticus]
MSSENEEWSVSYKQLGIVIIAFSLGLIIGLLALNSQGTTQSNFTTTELIGFVLSVILSGASIVLAVAAISLGKVSEKSVIERSDESIRLQNEVFTKTTEALLRIESSTGVTEKRIEDIISGRVGDISHQVAEIASRHTKSTNPQDARKLEEAIRKEIMNEVKAESEESRELRLARRRERQEKEKLANEQYLEGHDKILLGIGNQSSVIIEKVGHGTIGGEGANFDGLYTKGDKRFAVSTFRPDVDQNTVISFLPYVVDELTSQGLEHAYFVFFTDNDQGIDCNSMQSASSFLKEDVLAKLTFINASLTNPESAIRLITETL